jgi:hypothetical protein
MLSINQNYKKMSSTISFFCARIISCGRIGKSLEKGTGSLKWFI